jgi:hypothetical protein
MPCAVRKENMMYQDKFVVAIKANGKVLRENKDLVHLPFGSEFSVLVKNLNSRRAKFTLHIDGTDVLDGEEIIVNANSEVEMKRFIRNGNMDEGNAFKFIERTQAIEDGPRGIKMDDGVVRVQFWFEQAPPVITTTTHIHNDVWWNDYYSRRYFYRGPYTYHDGPFYGMNSVSGSLGDVKLGSATTASTTRGGSLGSGDKMKGMPQSMNVAQASSATFSSNASASASGGTATAYNASVDMTPTMDSFAPEVNEAGITVPGSKVDQKFTPVYGFNPEAISQVIIIRLAGKVGKVEVVTPVTVKTKQKCVTCGHVNKAGAKFCSDCGTSLELL